MLKTKLCRYEDIQRGTSLCIPVHIYDVDDNLLDVVDYNLHFTVKRVMSDEDTYDERAFISKTFSPYTGQQGTFLIKLLNNDTYIPVGKYFFDIELWDKKSYAVCRLATCEFELVGGPSNVLVPLNKDAQKSKETDTYALRWLNQSRAIDVHITESSPLVVHVF